MKALRQGIFFALVFLLFYLVSRVASSFIAKDDESDRVMITMIASLVYAGILIIIFYTAGICDTKDGYKKFSHYSSLGDEDSGGGPKAFTISPGAMCRGGAYMYQGNDERSKMCRAMAKTPEGRCAIAKFNCPNGFTGMPKVPLEFTSNSDSCWSGVRCKDGNVNMSWYKKHHPLNCKGCKMCSMWINN